MRRSRLHSLRLVACSLLLAAFCLPFVEVGDLLEDVWDDSPSSADVADGGNRLAKRPLSASSVPDGAAAPRVLAIAQSLPFLEPGFGLATPLALLAALRPPRPSFCPRDVERGPPAFA